MQLSKSNHTYKDLIIEDYEVVIPEANWAAVHRFDVFKDSQLLFSLRELIGEEWRIIKGVQGSQINPSSFAYEQGLVHVHAEIDQKSYPLGMIVDYKHKAE